MLISHTKKFIYIQTRHTAGDVIRPKLSLHSYLNIERERFRFPDRIDKAFGDDSFDRVFQSVTAQELPLMVGHNKFFDYFKFGFVRNSWELQVAQYKYIKATPEHPWHEEVLKMPFGEYLAWCSEHNRFLRQHHAFFEPRDTGVFSMDNCLVDFLCRHERLQNDFDHVCATLQIPFVKVCSSEESFDYRDYYDDAGASVVGRACSVDIRCFGFVFDEDLYDRDLGKQEKSPQLEFDLFQLGGKSEEDYRI
jgi:hypothetical protein